MSGTPHRPGSSIRLLCLSTLLACASPAAAIMVSDTPVPDTLELHGQHLPLNGAGIRNKYFMDLYIGALYLAGMNHDAASILTANEPMVLRLTILSDRITSQRMRDSSLEGFGHATAGNIAPLRAEIDTFLAAYSEPVKAGDVFEMRFTPAIGTEIIKNGKQVALIKGLAFKRALFGIWLCDEPAQESLRDEMLGLHD
jgi:hypothetical protein